MEGKKGLNIESGDSGKAGGMKGYKILADGRKTSFFHHEMSAEERELLGYDANGNLAPKAISAEEAKRMEEEKAKKAGDSSVWAGNTWEQKEYTPWALDKLKELLGECVFAVPEGGQIKVKGIKDWTGTASVHVKGSKKRHIFDLNMKVEWEASGMDGDDLSGEIKFIDVLPDDVDDEDVTGEVKITGESAAKELVAKYTSSPQRGLHEMILKRLAIFALEFRKL